MVEVRGAPRRASRPTALAKGDPLGHNRRVPWRADAVDPRRGAPRASGGTADALSSGGSVLTGVGVQIPPCALGVVHELCGYEFTNPGSGAILGRDSCCVGVLGLPCRLWAAVQRDGGARVRCRVFVGAWKWPRPEFFGLGPFMAGGSASRGSHSVDVAPGLFARYRRRWPAQAFNE